MKITNRELVKYFLVAFAMIIIMNMLYFTAVIPDVIYDENDPWTLFFMVQLILTFAGVCLYPFGRNKVASKFELRKGGIDIVFIASSVIFLVPAFFNMDDFIGMIELSGSHEMFANFLRGIGVFMSWLVSLAASVVILIEILVMDIFIPFIKIIKT